MDTSSFDHQWMRRAKWLTQALIISGTLNIGLFATFVYFVLKEKQTSISFEHKPLAEDIIPAVTNEEVLRTFSTLTFQELLFRLDDMELVEEGYTKRDLALASLVAFHHFNLERALGGLVLQQRQVTFSNLEGGEKIDLTIFPGLADYQYQAIVQYAKTEKWPFTSQGLFFEIKRTQSPRDPTILEAFYLTPEFQSVTTLFLRSGLIIAKETIIELLSQGDWKLLYDFSEQQKIAQDLTPNRRRSFLTGFLSLKSKIAARLFVEVDNEFALKRLDDTQILSILDTLTEKSSQLESFAKDLLTSPRCDAVLKRAAIKLYTFANEPVPEQFDHAAALRRFVPEHALTKEEEKQLQVVQAQPKPIEAVSQTKTSTPSKQKRIHVIQERDSLWKIARKYNVSVEAIMQVNNLESERLRVGKKLEIPESKKP